jgi:hypothetical protein
VQQVKANRGDKFTFRELLDVEVLLLQNKIAIKDTESRNQGTVRSIKEDAQETINKSRFLDKIYNK